MEKKQSSREISVNIIISVLEEEKLSHIVLRKALAEFGNTKEDNVEKAFITRLVQGTIEKKITIDYIIDYFSKIKTAKMKPFIRNLLRMSVYQIMYMDTVPDSAVCNEAVKLAKKRGFVNLSSFVNGILRNISRNKDNISFPNEKNKDEFLSVKYSMPKWIIKRFINEFGCDLTLKMLEALDEEKEGISVRVNTSKADIAKIIKILEDENVSVKINPLADNMLRISGFGAINELKAFKEGLIQPQDLSSSLVATISGAKPGDVCMDLCSAPGGKTIHLADMLKGNGKIFAGDLTEKKVDLIKENIERTGFSNITVNIWDATKDMEEYYETADVVIADVPCSGLGVINNKADIRYRLKEEDIKELSFISKKILECATKYLKKGGVLVFSTCTMTKEENDENRQFVIEKLGLEPVSIEEYLKEELLLIGENKITAKAGYLKLFISNNNDGFYISKFVKK